MKWLIDNKGLVLGSLIAICTFFIGRQTKSTGDDGTLKQLQHEGDSLRNAVKLERHRAIMEAERRSTLEKIYRDKLKHIDSLRIADKSIIKTYEGIIGVKHTPHELELEMAYIYSHRNVEPQH